jgi:hypothetical protein
VAKHECDSVPSHRVDRGDFRHDLSMIIPVFY